MHPLYDPLAPKKATNLSINHDLLTRAKALDINLSATLEQALAERIRLRLREEWLAENQAAIADYNQSVEAHGTFGDSVRTF